MENYASLSIETHLFFARIMKEHALFLAAGFPCQNEAWIQRADWFRAQFEKLLEDAVRIGDGLIDKRLIKSNELVTEFTIPAEKKTEQLSGIPIDSGISLREQQLRAGNDEASCRRMNETVHRMNKRAIELLNGLIDFKEQTLSEVSKGNLFNANYPLLIKHILREAELYLATLQDLMRNKRPTYRNLFETEQFWNRIMMEHALFIRGLLDPSETELITTADEFAMQYQKLLKAAAVQDRRSTEAMPANCPAAAGSSGNDLTRKSLEETLKYREFKTAGTEGILNNQIASIILPLLADHVLREANHYIRILECSHKD